MQVFRHLGQREAVAGRERQDDRVLGGRRLQLEVELAAEALAQRETACAGAALRPGASPSQNGMLGGAPCASSTRSRPASTRITRYDALPSWNTSPARLSIAKSSLTLPMRWLAGSSTTS